MYGKKYMGTGRTTFIINGDGIITNIIEKVDTKNASQQVLDLCHNKLFNFNITIYNLA
jgi:peroxiredoxin Q/BCP